MSFPGRRGRWRQSNTTMTRINLDRDRDHDHDHHAEKNDPGIMKIASWSCIVIRKWPMRRCSGRRRCISCPLSPRGQTVNVDVLSTKRSNASTVITQLSKAPKSATANAGDGAMVVRIVNRSTKTRKNYGECYGWRGTTVGRSLSFSNLILFSPYFSSIFLFSMSGFYLFYFILFFFPFQSIYHYHLIKPWSWSWLRAILRGTMKHLQSLSSVTSQASFHACFLFFYFYF